MLWKLALGDQLCLVTQEDDGIFLRLQLERQRHQDDEVVFEIGKDSKRTAVPRTTWAMIDVHINLALPEFLVDR